MDQVNVLLWTDSTAAYLEAINAAGLAAGDHLHFGVYLDGVAVPPVEWWDGKWIGDNITPKLAGLSGDAIHEAQQPRRAAKTKRRR